MQRKNPSQAWASGRAYYLHRTGCDRREQEMDAIEGKIRG
jgi:hypothetical protein